MPVTPIAITTRFTMQEWQDATDCCHTIAMQDNMQHRMHPETGEWITPEEVIDYERITPPISAFTVGDNVRIRPSADGMSYSGSAFNGQTGLVTSLDQGAVFIQYDIPIDSTVSTGLWTPPRVEIISFSERVYATPTVSPDSYAGGLAAWERELLSLNPFGSLQAATGAAFANIRSIVMGEKIVSSSTPSFTLTPQSEEDTQMNLAELTEKLVRNYVNEQGETAKLLLDTKASKALGVDARSIRRELKKYVESLSWLDRATVQYVAVSKLSGNISIIGSQNWLNDAVNVNGLLPNIVPLATALLVLKSALPEWVDLEADSGEGVIKVSTAKGAAFAEALTASVYGNLVSFGSRGVEANRFSTAVTQATRFRAEAAKQVFEAMKRIARRSILTKENKSSTGNFDSFMSTLRKERKSGDVILSRFIIPAHGLVSSRNWGIEVETAGARGVHDPAGWGSKGDSSLESAYGDQDEEQYCEEDHNAQVYRYSTSSYAPNPDWTDPDECEACIANNERDNDEGYRDCREFVSPILHSFHSKGLEKLVEEIATQPQNDTAGIHVHVDVSDLTPKQIGSLVYGYQIIEPLIEASYQRDVREYCKARRNSEVLDVIRQAKESPSMRTRDISTDSRYVALNLDSIRAHGTVEFRAMGPVYDYEYLIRWAYFCRELVNVAKANISQSEWNDVDSFEKLSALFIRRGAESVDTQLSTISDEDIKAMISKNRYNVEEDVYATVGGEI